jgi:hypothetical protein
MARPLFSSPYGECCPCRRGRSAMRVCPTCQREQRVENGSAAGKAKTLSFSRFVGDHSDHNT